jgi:hypothetical protein
LKRHIRKDIRRGKVKMDKIEEGIANLKRLRKQSLLLNIKMILSTYSLYWEMHRIKKKYPKIYADYLNNKREFWGKANDSFAHLKKSLREINKEILFSVKLRAYIVLGTRRRK